MNFNYSEWYFSTFLNSMRLPLENDVLTLYSVRNYVILHCAGTYNQNIHIYDATTLQYVVQWTGHVGIVNCIIVSPSGRFMFSSSSDSTVMVSNIASFAIIIFVYRRQ